MPVEQVNTKTSEVVGLHVSLSTACRKAKVAKSTLWRLIRDGLVHQDCLWRYSSPSDATDKARADEGGDEGVRDDHHSMMQMRTLQAGDEECLAVRPSALDSGCNDMQMRALEARDETEAPEKDDARGPLACKDERGPQPALSHCDPVDPVTAPNNDWTRPQSLVGITRPPRGTSEDLVMSLSRRVRPPNPPPPLSKASSDCGMSNGEGGLLEPRAFGWISHVWDQHAALQADAPHTPAQQMPSWPSFSEEAFAAVGDDGDRSEHGQGDGSQPRPGSAVAAGETTSSQADLSTPLGHAANTPGDGAGPGRELFSETSAAMVPDASPAIVRCLECGEKFMHLDASTHMHLCDCAHKQVAEGANASCPLCGKALGLRGGSIERHIRLCLNSWRIAQARCVRAVPS